MPCATENGRARPFPASRRAVYREGGDRPDQPTSAHPTCFPALFLGAAREAVLDPTRIGNTRQQNDNLIAVRNAKRLGECCQELTGFFEQTELQPTDYVPLQMATYRSMTRAGPDNPEGEAWIKSCIMSDKSVETLRRAIESGNFTIWRVHEAQEVPIAPIRLNDNNIIKYGIFIECNYPKPDMDGAYLWVKLSDWRSFLAPIVTPHAASFSACDDDRTNQLRGALPQTAANSEHNAFRASAASRATTPPLSLPGGASTRRSHGLPSAFSPMSNTSVIWRRISRARSGPTSYKQSASPMRRRVTRGRRSWTADVQAGQRAAFLRMLGVTCWRKS